MERKEMGAKNPSALLIGCGVRCLKMMWLRENMKEKHIHVTYIAESGTTSPPTPTHHLPPPACSLEPLHSAASPHHSSLWHNICYDSTEWPYSSMQLRSRRRRTFLRSAIEIPNGPKFCTCCITKWLLHPFPQLG